MTQVAYKKTLTHNLSTVSFILFLLIFFMPCVYANSNLDLNLPPPATNQNWQQHTFTLPELTDYALSHNPTTSLAWSEIKAALAAYGVAKSAYWPQIDSSVEASYVFNPDSGGGGNGGTDSTQHYSFSPGVNLNYLLFDFGTRSAQVANSRYQLIATRFTQNSNIQQLILQVDQAYYLLLGQQALVNANTLNLKQADESLKSATALHQQGLATMGDVYQAQSAYAQAQLALQQATGAYIAGRGQLATAVGLPVQTPIQVSTTDIEFPSQPLMRSIEKLLTLAKQQRPDLLAAQAQVQAAHATVIASERAVWPTLALSANAGETYPTGTFNNVQSNVMLTLSMPIFTGFQQTNAIQQAKAQEEVAQSQQDLLSNQIDLEVWQSYTTLQTAYRAIQSSEALLKSSIYAAQQALGQYRAGVGNIVTVLTTQASEAGARTQVIQAKLNWFTALSELSANLGTITARPVTPDSIGKP